MSTWSAFTATAQSIETSQDAGSTTTQGRMSAHPTPTLSGDNMISLIITTAAHAYMLWMCSPRGNYCLVNKELPI